MAAGVTDRLLEWSMLWICSMRLKPSAQAAAKITFNVEAWRIGGGCYVAATLPDGTSQRIENQTFATEGELGAGLGTSPLLGYISDSEHRSPRVLRKSYYRGSVAIDGTGARSERIAHVVADNLYVFEDRAG